VTKTNLSSAITSEAKLDEFGYPEVILPVFIPIARPSFVDPILIELDPNSKVDLVWSIGENSGRGNLFVFEYIKQIEEQITRQSEGFFTLDEAAQIFVDGGRQSTVKAAINLLREARIAGVGPTNSRYITRDSNRRPIHDINRHASVGTLVNVADINAYLTENNFGFTFPEAEHVPVLPSSGIDYTVLASRTQLISVFGIFTGMDKKWFKNLNDTPKLKAACKVNGQSKKGQTTEPCFCPIEVMRWLIDPKRKKGKPLSVAKGWQLLQQNFEKVYNQNSIDEPHEPATG
jgi:hypothetical protein